VRTKCAGKTCVGLWGYSWGPRELPGVGGPDLGEVGRYTLLPRWRTLERGKPQAGWWNARRGAGSAAGYTRSVEAARGQKKPRRSRIGRPSGIGDVAGSQWLPPCPSRHRQGQKGLSPSRTPWGGSRVRARAWRSCQLGGPAVPFTRARSRHGPVGAVRHCGGEKMGKKEEVRLTSWSHPSVKEGKEKASPVGGLASVAACWAGWAGRRLGKEKGGPISS
jgi:hypothetical protein